MTTTKAAVPVKANPAIRIQCPECGHSQVADDVFIDCDEWSYWIPPDEVKCEKCGVVLEPVIAWRTM